MDEKLNKTEATLAFDLTGGHIARHLESITHVPLQTDLHFSRIRRTDDGSLDTTGHTVSRSVEQLRGAIAEADPSQVLLLDDTSFSGTTNLLAERHLRDVFLDADSNFQHGFLIANNGELGPGVPGAVQRLGKVAAGHIMSVPQDDGWHIFDIVKQPNLENHLTDVQRALHDATQESAIFTGTLSSDELRARADKGEFVSNGEITGAWHARNPQLLPRIIAAGHIEPVQSWRADEDEVFNILLKIGQILEGDAR